MTTVKCGTIVIPTFLNIEGTITACCIRWGNVQYEFSYFISGEQKVIWLNENEFTISKGEKVKVGFKNN